MDEILRKPIHYAAVCSGTGPLKYLISKGVELREGDKEKNTPLILAAKYGRACNIKVLMEQLDASFINVKNKEGNAPIHLAC